MTVNFSTSTSKIGYVPTVTVSNAVKQPVATKEVIKADTLEKTDKKDKKEKTSLFSGISKFIGGIKKFFASLGEYTKGIVKGITSGAIAGSLIYTGSTILKTIKKKQKNTAGVILSGVAAAGVFVYNLYKAYLNTNNKTAEIDHRYR